MVTTAPDPEGLAPFGSETPHDRAGRVTTTGPSATPSRSRVWAQHPVPLAEAIEQCAEGFERVAQTMVNNSDTTPEERQEQRRVLDESYEQVVAAVPPFVVAARAYLNGDPASR